MPMAILKRHRKQSGIWKFGCQFWTFFLLPTCFEVEKKIGFNCVKGYKPINLYNQSWVMPTPVSFVAIPFGLILKIHVKTCVLHCCPLQASVCSTGHMDLLRSGARSNNSVACKIRAHHPIFLQHNVVKNICIHCMNSAHMCSDLVVDGI